VDVDDSSLNVSASPSVHESRSRKRTYSDSETLERLSPSSNHPIRSSDESESEANQHIACKESPRRSPQSTESANGEGAIEVIAIALSNALELPAISCSLSLFSSLCCCHKIAYASGCTCDWFKFSLKAPDLRERFRRSPVVKMQGVTLIWRDSFPVGVILTTAYRIYYAPALINPRIAQPSTSFIKDGQGIGLRLAIWRTVWPQSMSVMSPWREKMRFSAPICTQL